MFGITTIAVIGAGTMGRGISGLAAIAGYDVRLLDISLELVDEGVANIADDLRMHVSNGLMTRETMNICQSNIKGFTNLKGALHNVDYVVEAIPEVLTLKQKLFEECDKYAPKHAILASNSSTISTTQLAKATLRPENVVGLHFLLPVSTISIVEVVRGAKTSDETINASCDLIRSLRNLKGKMKPIRVEKDTPGFIYNRVSGAAGLYLMWLLEMGLDPESIDEKVRSMGSQMGPYELLDYSGLDVILNVMQYFSDTLTPEFKPAKWLEKKVKEGHLGRKTGKGIYDWPNGERIKNVIGNIDPDFDPLDLLCLQVNEGTKLLEAGVTKSAAEIDLVAKVNISQSRMPSDNMDKDTLERERNNIGPFMLGKAMGWDTVAAKCLTLAKRTGIKWFMPTETLKNGSINI